MNRTLVFLSGIAVGVAVMLALQPSREEVEPPATVAAAPAQSTPSRVAATATAPDTAGESPMPPEHAATPIVETVATDPGLPPPTTFVDALQRVGGDPEALVIHADVVQGSHIRHLIRGSDFSMFVSALSQSRSITAMENYAKYRERYESMPAVRNGEVSIQEFACGARVCAASLRAEDEIRLWNQLLVAVGKKQRPVEIPRGRGHLLSFGDGITMVLGSPTGGAADQRRIIFVVDPDIRSYHTRRITEGYWKYNGN